MTKLNVPIYYVSLYSAVCLFTAAKAIELDQRIPFIPKLVRTCSDKFSVQDVRVAEIQILEACNWNPLYPTLIEFIEFYLTQGVVYGSDQVRVQKEVKVQNELGVLKEQ